MTVVITGASSGIGAALAKHYAVKGNHLILLARRYNRLVKLRETLQHTGASFELLKSDMTTFDTLQTQANTIAKQPLDLIILNAGISTGHGSTNPPFNLAKKVYDTNLLSLHAFLEPIISTLQQQNSGHIVFISSLASLFTMPSSIIYGSSKRAVNAYAEGLRYALHPNHVDVSVIQPGFIQSELTDKNDFSMPFLLTLEEGSNRIYKAIEKRKRNYAFPRRFVAIIALVNLLPYFLRAKIITHKKPSQSSASL